MSVRRVGLLAVMALPMVLWVACGQVYRPVVIPCSTGGVPGCPIETNPSPGNFHAVFGISSNIPGYSGEGMQIDVSGDSVIGETSISAASAPNSGLNPTHAAIFPNKSKVFVTTAGSVFPGGADSVSAFSPVFQSTLGTGLGAVSTISLPTGSQPVFVNTTQNNAVYVADFGTNAVSAINTLSNVVTSVSVGTNPVSLAETPNGLKVYVANQGSNSVSSLNTVDLSQNTVTGFAGVTPVWVVARGDSQKVYVLTQGDGQLVTIDTATDTVASSLSVGAGANFIFFDPNLNRLYVTNPVTGMVYVFSDTGTNDTPTQLAAISMSGGANPACPSGCAPVSVTALLDGSRFYVASYQTSANCPDSNVVGNCIIPGLTVFDANSLTVKYPSAPTLNLLSWPVPCTPTSTTQCPATHWPFATNQFAVAPLTSCVRAATYTPLTTRFRVFTVAAADSSRVYVSMCDAGAVAVVNTTSSNTNNSGGAIPPDSLITDVLAAYGAGPAQANTGEPAPQNPIFLLMGQ
jgi:YVTN family beta-propeller protein